MEIRRQGETHDPHRVRGPADTRNQVRSVAVRIDAMGDGRLRISAPHARGWAREVRTRDELVRAVAEAFTEAQIASYPRWKGVGYDLDQLATVWRDDADPMVAAGPQFQASRAPRADVHDPMAWTPLDDGRWRSPGGKVYGPETAVVQKVMRKRAGFD